MLLQILLIAAASEAHATPNLSGLQSDAHLIYCCRQRLTWFKQVTEPSLKALPKRPARPAICFTSGGVRGLRLSPSNLDRLLKMMRLHTDGPAADHLHTTLHMSTGCRRGFACSAPVVTSVDSRAFLELPELEEVAVAELHLTLCKAAGLCKATCMQIAHQ